MDAKSFFNAENYFRGLCDSNRLARENAFQFCTCSGIEGLEGALARFRSAKAILCVDDTNDGSLIRARSGGWVKKRVFTVFILHRYRVGDMDDRAAKLDTCRQLFRQLMSKMIIDEHDLANELIYLDTSTVMSRELGSTFLSDCTGLYFLIDCSEPTDVSFNSEEWM